jgi:hypothetical protein
VAAQEKRSYTLGNFMWEFKQTEIATRIIDDFDNFLDGKFDQMSSIRLIVEELNILKIIN